MRALICGGRDFGEKESSRLGALAALSAARRNLGITFIIEGGASGADAIGREFRRISGLPGETFKADWLRHGRAAGPIRNQRMIDEGKPDLVLAFPGGRGTADMVSRAEKAGIRVIRFNAPDIEE